MREAEIRGIVEGEPGAVLAGWARIGSQRHHARGTVRVRTEHGLVEVEVPASAALGPVESLTADWHSLESHPAAQLCLAEAPAPDDETKLSFALVRGGDTIIAVGVVAGEQLVTEPEGGLRAGASARITRLSAHVIGIGLDADAVVARLRREAARARSTPQDRAKAAPRRPARVPRPYATSRRNTALAVGAACAIAGAGALLARSPVPLLLATVALAFPLVVDELVLPDLHPVGRRATPWLAHAAGTMFCIAAAVVPTIGWGFVFDAKTPERTANLRLGMIVVAGIALLAALATRLLDAGRRRMLARLARAAPHPTPLVDGVWGSTDGPVGYTKGFEVEGMRVAAAAGRHLKSYGAGKNTSTHAEKFQGAATHLTVGDTPVITAGGHWLSLQSVERASGDRRTTRAEIIEAGAPIRVLGRAKHGSLAAGGPHTLLIFAAPHGTNVGVELAALRARLRLDSALAMVGAVASAGIALYGTSL